MHIEPYLFFNGRCEEAIAFYKRALGAEVLMMMRNKEAPEQPPPGMLPPGSEDADQVGKIIEDVRGRAAAAGKPLPPSKAVASAPGTSGGRSVPRTISPPSVAVGVTKLMAAPARWGHQSRSGPGRWAGAKQRCQPQV